jgi:hypothetical protein
MAVFLMATLLTLFLSSFLLMDANNKVIGRQLTFYGQASNAAQAGLVEALSWFRKQATQPVTTFAPQRNLASNPPLNETDDAAIGIVRDYEISHQSNIWGRYEVRKTAVVDVSRGRGKTGSGTVWQVQSLGIVYVRNASDMNVPYNQAPNKVLNTQTAQTEFQRMSMVLPGQAGINSDRADRVTLTTRARVFGGNRIGVVYPASTGSVSVCAYPCQVTGTPATSQASPYDGSIAAVFGLQQQELINMADLVVANQTELPAQLPDMSLIVVTGNATFDADRPLTGSGMLVVLGNLTISANSYSSYNGLIYVAGAYQQNAPSSVSGSVLGHGTIQLTGTGDFAEVSYDQSMLQQVQQLMGQYRYSRSISFGTTWR